MKMTNATGTVLLAAVLVTAAVRAEDAVTNRLSISTDHLSFYTNYVSIYTNHVSICTNDLTILANRLSLSARFGFNISGKFKGIATVCSPSLLPIRAGLSMAMPTITMTATCSPTVAATSAARRGIGATTTARARFSETRSNPDAMQEPHRLDGPPLFHFVEQPIELVLDHFLKRLVFEGADRRVLLRAAHHAEKINRGAHVRGQYSPGEQGRFVDRLGGDDELARHET